MNRNLFDDEESDMPSGTLGDCAERSARGDRTSGLSITDILTLPESEQQLMTWMVRQKEVSLSEAAVYMNQEEEVIESMLNSLTQQGFVRELEVEGKLYYRPCLTSKKGSRISQNIWQQLDE